MNDDERWEKKPADDPDSDYYRAEFVLRDPPCQQRSGLWEIGGVRYRARVKRDGCVDFYHTFNAPMDTDGHNPDDVDYMHICDIDELIEYLSALKVAAVAHFGEWPD